MLFSQTLATIRAANDGFTAEVGDDWSQGRAVFGGMVGALGNEIMRRLVPPDRPLRGLEVTFVGPMLAGTVRAEAEILRIGKSTTIASARLFSGEELVTTLTGVYGAGRKVAVSIDPKAQEGVAPAETLPERALVGAGLPRFLQHFAMRFAEGAYPFSGTPLPSSKVYFRHRDPAPLTESHVVALIDAIPPPILQMMTAFVPNSSLTWTLDFFRHDYSYASTGWWRIDTDTQGAADGYVQESSVVLDPDGVPFAFSRQLVAIFG